MRRTIEVPQGFAWVVEEAIHAGVAKARELAAADQPAFLRCETEPRMCVTLAPVTEAAPAVTRAVA